MGKEGTGTEEKESQISFFLWRCQTFILPNKTFFGVTKMFHLVYFHKTQISFLSWACKWIWSSSSFKSFNPKKARHRHGFRFQFRMHWMNEYIGVLCFKYSLEPSRPRFNPVKFSEWIWAKRKKSVRFNIPSEIFYFLMMTAALADNY